MFSASKTDLIFLPTHLARSKSMPSGRKLRKYNKTCQTLDLITKKTVITCFIKGLGGYLLWQVELAQGPMRYCSACMNSTRPDQIRLVWFVRKEINQIDSVRILLRGQVSCLCKRDHRVSVRGKQKATIKLLASLGSQPSLPSLPHVNSTLAAVAPWVLYSASLSALSLSILAAT